MKVVITPDSYKESLSVPEVATAMEQGFREIWPDADYVRILVADDGEGVAEAMVTATQGHLVHVDVAGPLDNTIQAFYGLSGDECSAFIEMAAASGLEQAPVGLRDPLKTTPQGTGELIRHALGAGVEHIIIGIGGSATNDDGAGIAQVLGAGLLDAQNNEITQGGIDLESLPRIGISQLDSRLAGYCIGVACDVTNPLTGKKGTSAVSGPQKGATPEMIARLDRALTHYAQLITHDLNVNVLDLVGGDAAGGMGAVLYAFCGTKLRCGTEIVADALHLNTCVAGTDLVVTGEGRIDSQTIHGKIPVGVAKVAKRCNKPVIDVAGSLTADVGVIHERELGTVFSVVYTICTLDEALEDMGDNMRMTARNMAATLRAGQQLR